MVRHWIIYRFVFWGFFLSLTVLSHSRCHFKIHIHWHAKRVGMSPSSYHNNGWRDCFCRKQTYWSRLSSMNEYLFVNTELFMKRVKAYLKLSSFTDHRDFNASNNNRPVNKAHKIPSREINREIPNCCILVGVPCWTTYSTKSSHTGGVWMCWVVGGVRGGLKVKFRVSCKYLTRKRRPIRKINISTLLKRNYNL